MSPEDKPRLFIKPKETEKPTKVEPKLFIKSQEEKSDEIFAEGRAFINASIDNPEAKRWVITQAIGEGENKRFILENQATNGKTSKSKAKLEEEIARGKWTIEE